MAWSYARRPGAREGSKERRGGFPRLVVEVLLIAWVIRSWGGYPDGFAFAVLLMNLAAPLIDRYTVPRIYGHAGE